VRLSVCTRCSGKRSHRRSHHDDGSVYVSIAQKMNPTARSRPNPLPGKKVPFRSGEASDQSRQSGIVPAAYFIGESSTPTQNSFIPVVYGRPGLEEHDQVKGWFPFGFRNLLPLFPNCEWPVDRDTPTSLWVFGFESNSGGTNPFPPLM
jgi:hypothetical protein